MSSSDSDDDCYGNISKKLQNMKKKYNDDNIDTANLLNTSSGINNTTQSITPESNSDDKCIILEDDDTIIDQIIALNSIQKHSRRGRSANSRSPRSRAGKSNRGRSKPNRGKRNASLDISDNSLDLCPARNTRSATLDSSCILIPDSPIRGVTRGRVRNRSRARGSKARSRRSRDTYPIYSVGNTDDYPDMSDDVQLFNTNPKPQEIIDDIIDENEELSIKVYWQSSDIIKFTIRKYQKLSQLFDFFSKRENVGIDKLLLTYNDRILKPDDTPDSIDYNIAKFIDGGIVNNRVPILEDAKKDVTSGIKIKFQCQNAKKPLEITIQPADRLIQAFTKCAEHLEVPLNKLKFEFDGDCIAGSMTAQDLELEGGECIDVKLMR